MSSPAVDDQLASALAERTSTAHTRFQHEFHASLESACEQFLQNCVDCRRRFDSLSPHVGFAAGRGFVRSHKQSGDATPLSAYVDSLYLQDLFHSAACLDWQVWDVPEPQCDPAAVASLDVIAQTRIRPTLLNRFRHSQCVDDVAGDLPGHVLLPGRTGESRLAAYDGRSELVTWLTSIAFRMVLTCLRKQRHKSPPATDVEAELPSSNPQSGADPLSFIRRFFSHLVELVEGIRDRERMKWLDDSSDLSTREKEKYRTGLTDRQKIVFRLLYHRGLRPSEVAEILCVSKAYISKCIRIYRERLVTLADSVITELADEANVDTSVVDDELEKLFHFLASSEWNRAGPRPVNVNCSE